MCCCGDIRKTSYIASFFLVIISAGAMVGIYYLVNKMSKGWMLHSDASHVFFQIFGAMYTICYVALIIRASMKYSRTKELFTLTNAKLMILSGLLLYPMGL
jgi:hypothetical protein